LSFVLMQSPPETTFLKVGLWPAIRPEVNLYGPCTSLLG
jgi:hypothetical protein